MKEHSVQQLKLSSTIFVTDSGTYVGKGHYTPGNQTRLTPLYSLHIEKVVLYVQTVGSIDLL